MFIAGRYPTKIRKVFILSQEGIHDEFKIQIFGVQLLRCKLTAPLCILLRYCSPMTAVHVAVNI